MGRKYSSLPSHFQSSKETANCHMKGDKNMGKLMILLIFTLRITASLRMMPKAEQSAGKDVEIHLEIGYLSYFIP